MTRLLVALLLAVWSPICAATDPEQLACKGISVLGPEMAAKAIPHFARRCFALGMRHIRDATGRDFNLLEAENIFGNIKRLRPESAYGYMGIAELEMRKREFHLVAKPTYEIYGEALVASLVKPAVAESYVTLGRASLLMGCMPCASQAVTTAEKLGVSSMDLRVLQSRVSEREGDEKVAELYLLQALKAPLLNDIDRSNLHLEIGSFYARCKRFAGADQQFAEAIFETPKRVVPYLKRAAFELYVRGEAKAASAIAGQANRLAPVSEAKRILSMAEYLDWASNFMQGRPTKDIQRIAQVAYVTPEEAFVEGARYPAVSKIVEAILKASVIKGVEVRDGKGNTGLLAAGIGNNAAVARLLIVRHANINAENSNRERVLSFFIIHGNQAMVANLLQAGAEVDYSDNDGNTPLLLAVRRRDSRLVADLLQRKVKTRLEKVWSGGDLLSIAAMTDDVKTATVLLQSGVEADLPDRYGNPALVMAAIYGSKAVAKLLLDHGARPNAAMGMARQLGNHEILELLQAAAKHAI